MRCELRLEIVDDEVVELVLAPEGVAQGANLRAAERLLVRLFGGRGACELSFRGLGFRV